MHSVVLRALLAMCLSAMAVSARAEEDVSRPPYEPDGVLYEGYASIPWHVAFSPDGRFVAVVEGYVRRFVLVLDAKTSTPLARFTTETQPASHQPVFTRDGERLVMIENDALVMRARKGGWKIAKRVPLGFRPKITRIVRPIVLSPDENEVTFVDNDSAWSVSLKEMKASRLGPPDAYAAHYVGGRRAVARWGATVAETVLLPAKGRKATTLPFALLATAPRGRWLVARAPRDKWRGELYLLDAGTHAALGTVAVEDAQLHAAVFSADGAHLATIETRRIGVIRDSKTGAILQRIAQYEGDRMISCGFAPDGGRLVTAGRRADKDVFAQSVMSWRRVPSKR